VVCDAHLCLLAWWVMQLLLQWMMHCRQVNGSTACELFPCTHRSTSHTRLEGPQVLFFKSLVWPNQVSNSVHQVCWHVLNQLGHLAGVYGLPSLMFGIDRRVQIMFVHNTLYCSKLHINKNLVAKPQQQPWFHMENTTKNHNTSFTNDLLKQLLTMENFR